MRDSNAGVDAPAQIGAALRAHLAVAEGAVDQSAAVLRDLAQVRELLLSAGVSSGHARGRQLARAKLLAAREQMERGELGAAIAAMEAALEVYRAERWTGVQAEVTRDLLRCYRTSRRPRWLALLSSEAACPSPPRVSNGRAVAS